MGDLPLCWVIESAPPLASLGGFTIDKMAILSPYFALACSKIALNAMQCSQVTCMKSTSRTLPRWSCRSCCLPGESGNEKPGARRPDSSPEPGAHITDTNARQKKRIELQTLLATIS